MVPLNQEPGEPVGNLDQLMAVAAAMEEQAVRLYQTLAATMDRRGAASVAAVFRRLAAMERDHVGEVDRWSRSVTGRPATATAAAAAEIWQRVAVPTADEAASDRLSPYRALSIAVRLEERAFAFYTYLMMMAPAAGPVRHHAESLARQELEHAALLRIERRQAYRAEHAARPLAGLPQLDDPTALAALAAAGLSQVSARVAGLARRLAADGCDPDGCDPDGAAVLQQIAGRLADQAGQQAVRAGGTAVAPADLPPLEQLLAGPATGAPLADALQMLERLYDSFEALAGRTAAEPVMVAAQAVAESLLAELSLVRERLE